MCFAVPAWSLLMFIIQGPLLLEIDSLYEVYRGTTDEAARKALYAQIDSVSQLASTFAIANEYDKMVSEMGAKGTNAYTSQEETVYINDIPTNQLEKWLNLEAERFRNPQLRLFHTPRVLTMNSLVFNQSKMQQWWQEGYAHAQLQTNKKPSEEGLI